MNQLTQVQKRRDKLVIMSEVLQIARTGALKTQIMYGANLSFAQLKEYLNLLTAVQLLKRATWGDKETYLATEKGVEFLKRQREIMTFLTSDTECTAKERVPSPGLLIRNRKEEN